ncbi:MAG: hypothetical protein M0031_12260 [Thermaerobacter sp.]|nr:hypothetical protein [Thermaerobacter sp.]
MKRIGAVAVAGLALVLAAAGCGPSKPAAAPPAANSSGGGSVANSPSWNGNGTSQRLSKLGNYSYRSNISLGVQGKQGTAMIVEGYYHSPTQYKLVVSPGTPAQVTLIAADDGHYYYQATGVNYDMGTKKPNSFESMAAEGIGGWGSLWSGAKGTYTGPCSVAGRSGNSFQLASAAVGISGVSESERGSACVDSATGAPLSSTFEFTVSTSKGSVTDKDSLQVTGVGNVPPIAPPAGAKPMPSFGG